METSDGELCAMIEKCWPSTEMQAFCAASAEVQLKCLETLMPNISETQRCKCASSVRVAYNVPMADSRTYYLLFDFTHVVEDACHAKLGVDLRVRGSSGSLCMHVDGMM